tara:strand:+ start:696 stop:944 length:249 start_codon:yes stop_codon:yes gene_type:complete
MSDISVSEASTFTLLQELIKREDDTGDLIFQLNALSFKDDTVYLITGISVKKPMYISLDKKQEPIVGSQVPPIQTASKEEEE